MLAQIAFRQETSLETQELQSKKNCVERIEGPLLIPKQENQNGRGLTSQIGMQSECETLVISFEQILRSRLLERV